MAKVITCDKCGTELDLNYKAADRIHLQGIRYDLGLIDLDLCSSCYELLEDWLMESPDGTVKVYKKSL